MKGYEEIARGPEDWLRSEQKRLGEKGIKTKIRLDRLYRRVFPVKLPKTDKIQKCPVCGRFWQRENTWNKDVRIYPANFKYYDPHGKAVCLGCQKWEGKK